MLAYFIPLAVLGAPLLSTASPIVIGGGATATLTIFQCPTVSASPPSASTNFAGLPIILSGAGSVIPVVNNVLSSVVSPAIGIPSNVAVDNVVSPVVSVATAVLNPSAIPSVLSAATSIVRDPISLPSGVIPSEVGSAISAIVSAAPGPISPSGGSGDSNILPSNVLSSAVSAGSAIPADATAILDALRQAAGSLTTASSSLAPILRLLSSLTGTISSIAGTLSQVTSGITALTGQLGTVLANVQSLNGVLTGLTSSASSAAGAAQVFAQGTDFANQVGALTSQINALSSSAPLSVDRTALRAVLQRLQLVLQTTFAGLAPHCGSQSSALTTAWQVKNAAFSTCIAKL